MHEVPCHRYARWDFSFVHHINYTITIKIEIHVNLYSAVDLILLVKYVQLLD